MRSLTRVPQLVSILALASIANAQAAWNFAYLSQSPPADHQWASAFDEVRGEAIFMFPRQATNQGWRWNGTGWSQLSGPLPPSRIRACMVFDAIRGCVVLWGGESAGQLFADMWEWNGTTWTQRFVAMPPARMGAGAAYDRSRSVTVMFGGYSTGLLQDTWEWNGTSWSNPNPSARPSAREGIAMAFDPASQRVLLYGGQGANGIKNLETWTWNGVTWQQQFSSSPPFLRDQPAMAADLARKRVVLYGGHYQDYSTWEWDGAQWHMSFPGSPGPLKGAAAVYDSVRREIVLHGGEYGPYSNQTWIYRTPSLATVTSFGAGCAGSAGVPSLANAPYSLPWIGDTVRNRVTGLAPGSIGSLFVSSVTQLVPPTSLASFGAPGCDALVQPDVVELRPPVAGVVDWTLAIPSTTSLAGAIVFQQAFPVDATANPLGVSATNGLQMVVGIR